MTNQERIDELEAMQHQLTVKEELEAIIAELKAKVTRQRKGRKAEKREWEEKKAELVANSATLSDMLTASKEAHKKTKKTLVSLQNTPTQKEIQRLKDSLAASDAAWVERASIRSKTHREEIEEMEKAHREEIKELRQEFKAAKEGFMLDMLIGTLEEPQRDLLNAYLESTQSEP